MKSGRVGKLTLSMGLAISLIIVVMLVLSPQRPDTDDTKVLALNPDIEHSIPDFSAIADVTEKKKAFFDYLRPMIARQNEFIRIDRDFLLSQLELLTNGESLSSVSIERIQGIADNYQYNFRQISSKALTNLLMRVDLVPADMILIQAANETGWGSSRFANEGNNFFGQWCFRKGCGLVPQSRSSGLNHEVAVYKTVEDSVASYLKNLNTNAAYLEFRQLRAGLRSAGEELNADTLIHGLINYSERQQEYIDELLQMLRHNRQLLG
ncbi:glucosaminidase domain-containing protein [Paraferrimonas haliotis]|uniref:glucosaminidase domain-containing protein n=1 Tax=Paraferrimonas haliotis TaxID=2013866 RepID=UPI000BA96D83|nr:glucosaminidase domain-containing protein [Paraferrimonas haliotis]